MSYRIIILEENDPKDSDRYAISGCQVITAPSPEMVERAAKALAYEAGKDITGWDSTPDPFLNPYRDKARTALTAALFEEEE